MTRFLLILAPCLLFGESWTEFRFGPYEVLTEKNEKEARETLNYLEQLRHTVATLLGVQEVTSVWPIRVVVTDRKARPMFPTLQLGRDAWMASVSGVEPELAASATKVFLDSWPGHVPHNIERGLVQLVATLEVSGTKVSLGAVPAQRDRDWSRAHMLAVAPEYSGKLRVLLGNLSKGVDPDVAYGNAFGKTAAEVEADLDKYIAAGRFGTIPISGKPINAQRQFRPKEVPESTGLVALADVRMAHGDQQAASAYQALFEKFPQLPEAREGLGILTSELKYLVEAKGARALMVRASLTKDAAERQTLLQAAAKANPRWAQPWKELAAIETHTAQKLAALRTAAQLDGRDPANWMALARAQEANKQFAEAGKSWTAAERSTDDPNQRAKIREARTASEDRRVAQQIADRDAVRRKAEQELQDLRNKALTEIRRAEARANEGKPVIDPKTLDEFKAGPETKKLKGTLQRVDCLGGPARLHIAQGRQVIRILVRDGNAVEITGGGEQALACGPLKRGRAVSIEYIDKKDNKQLTAGEAVKIEFH